MSDKIWGEQQATRPISDKFDESIGHRQWIAAELRELGPSLYLCIAKNKPDVKQCRGKGCLNEIIAAPNAQFCSVSCRERPTGKIK